MACLGNLVEALPSAAGQGGGECCQSHILATAGGRKQAHAETFQATAAALRFCLVSVDGTGPCRMVIVVVHYLQSQFRGIACALVLADEIFFLGKDVGIAIIKHRTDAVLQHPLYDSAGTWGATAVQKNLGHGLKVER